MEAPEPGEPLVVLGVSIPWNDQHKGWFMLLGYQRLGIERHDFREGSGKIVYRYLQLNGGHWSMYEDIDFSIDAMLRELRKLRVSPEFMGLLLALNPEQEISDQLAHQKEVLTALWSSEPVYLK